MTIYNRTIDNLKTLCLKNQEECKRVLSIGDELRLFLDGFMDEEIAPPKEIIPLLKRVDFIWKNFESLNLMLGAVIDIDGLSDLNDDNIRQTIKKEQNLLVSLQEIGEVFVQAEYLLNDAKRICDYWFRQKWLNGECVFGFNHRFEKCRDVLLSGFSETIQTLEKSIQQLIDIKNTISMVCVYAAPEFMQESVSLNDNTNVYPLIHSKQFNKQSDFEKNIVQEHFEQMRTEVADDVFFNNCHFCMYCGQRIKDDIGFCSKCGRSVEVNVDLDATIQFCRYCEKDIPMIATFCPFCGKQVRITSAPTEVPMVCVYASPEYMGKTESKSNFFNKIFRRKK